MADCVYFLLYLALDKLSFMRLINDVLVLGYEPADLTVHPPPRTAEGGFIFFV